MELLKEPVVRHALRQAWYDSEPAPFGAHEEGGFILRDANGELSIARWTHGIKLYIDVPPHPGCRYEGKDIVATFHTHPNTGKSYDPEPSDHDVDSVHNDQHLKGKFYVGEFVISAETIYLIPPIGYWREVATTGEIIEWQP